MPNTFVNGRGLATASLQTVYTAPSTAGNVAIVLQAQATNVASGTQTFTLCWYDASGGVKTELVKVISIPQGSSIGCIAGKQILMASDYLQIQSTGSNLIEFTLSVLEIT